MILCVAVRGYSSMRFLPCVKNHMCKNPRTFFCIGGLLFCTKLICEVPLIDCINCIPPELFVQKVVKSKKNINNTGLLQALCIQVGEIL